MGWGDRKGCAILTGWSFFMCHLCTLIFCGGSCCRRSNTTCLEILFQVLLFNQLLLHVIETSYGGMGNVEEPGLMNSSTVVWCSVVGAIVDVIALLASECSSSSKACFLCVLCSSMYLKQRGKANGIAELAAGPLYLWRKSKIGTVFWNVLN